MSLRADLLRSEKVSNKRTAKKKKLRTAGFFGDIYNYATGKKKKRSDREGDAIDDILNQDQTRPKPPKQPEEENS